MDLEKICNNVIQIATEVGQYVREHIDYHKNNNFEQKGLHDFVTEIDKNSEKKIITALSKLLPKAGFIAEEQTKTETQDVFNWVVDPIDGTTNFIHGVYPHAISVALLENNKPILGVVYEIGRNECFYTWENAPAYCNKKQIHVSNNKSIANSLIGTGFPYNDFLRLNEFIKTMEFFMKNAQGIRRFGSAATDLAYVACGRFDAFYEYGLKPWDVAAGILLVENAGGKTSDFSGNDTHMFHAEIIASNSYVYAEFLHTISNIMLQ